jgi:AmmeMemoRadiSam system protein A
MLPLSPAQRDMLLRAARAAVIARVSGAAPPDPSDSDALIDRGGGTFVTIRIDGELRGCIGQIAAAGPLLATVMQCAVSSATDDPRFPPMRPEEIAAARFEISILSDPELLREPEHLRVGAHGLLVTRGRSRGLLLPQVAIEQGWNATQLLEGACLKAGLRPDAWRESGTRVEVFTAEVFGDPA